MSRETPLWVLAADQFGSPWPAEEHLLMALDRRAGGVKMPCVMDGGKDEIRLALLRWLLLSREAVERIAPFGLEIRCARIVGPGDLRSIQVPFRLAFVCCDLPDGIDLSGSAIRGDLSFEGSQIGNVQIHPCPYNAAIEGITRGKGALLENKNGIAVNLHFVQTDGSAIFDQSIVNGEVTLRGASIKGSLRCRGANFTNERKASEINSKALQANGLQVEGSVLLDEGFESRGEIAMVGARIGGSLRLSKAKLVGTPSCLVADHVRIGGSIISSRFNVGQKGEVTADAGVCAVGEVRMLGAHIEGNVEFNASIFCNVQCDGEGAALVLRGAEIGGTLSLALGFTAYGEVSIEGAKVDRNLICIGGGFHNPSGQALNANGIRVQGFARLMQGRRESSSKTPQRFKSCGEVNFDGARIDGDLDCSNGYFVYSSRMKNSVPEGAAAEPEKLKRWALRAHGARIGGSLLMEGGVSASGGVSLASAWIGRNLRCCGGSFEAGDGKDTVALRATTMEVEGNAKLDKGEELKTTYSGLVELGGTTIHGDLDFTGATFKGKKSGVQAQNLLVTDCFYWRNISWDPNSTVMEFDLKNARVGTLVDEPEPDSEKKTALGPASQHRESTPGKTADTEREPKANEKWLESWPCEVKLEGFAYNALLGSSDYSQREKWLEPWSRLPAQQAQAANKSEKQRPSHKPFTQWLKRLRNPLQSSSGRWVSAFTKWLKRLRHPPSSIQPYRQLARVLRARGHETEADKIMRIGGWAEFSVAMQQAKRWKLLLSVFLSVLSAVFLLCSVGHYLFAKPFDSASPLVYLPIDVSAGLSWLPWQWLVVAGAFSLLAWPLFTKPGRLLILGLGVGFGYNRGQPIVLFGLLLLLNWGIFQFFACRMTSVQTVAERREEHQLADNRSAPITWVFAKVGSAKVESGSSQGPPDFSPFVYSLDALIFLFTPQNFGEITDYQPIDPEHCPYDWFLRNFTRFDHLAGAVLLVLFVAAMTGIIRKD